MARHGKKASVFGYRDYRLYLKDWYSSRRSGGRAYSFRALAKRGGFKSTNFLWFVMQGKRNLTEESLSKVVRILNLNRQEEEFFRNLVFFNQATTHEEKNSYFRHLIRSKKFGQLKPLEKGQYRYYSAWYHPVVRELVVSEDFDGTPEWLAKRISPPVTPAQAARSIELLQELGLITKNGRGKWKQARAVIHTGAELTSVVIHNYHKSILSLTHQVLDQLVMPNREVSSLTLGVRREKIPDLRRKIQEFRKEILETVAEETEPEDVVLLNIQFYPVTQTPVSSSAKGGD